MATKKYNANFYGFRFTPVGQTIADILLVQFPTNMPIGLQTLDLRKLEVYPTHQTQAIIIVTRGEASGCIPEGGSMQLANEQGFVVTNDDNLAYDLANTIEFSSSDGTPLNFILTF